MAIDLQPPRLSERVAQRQAVLRTLEALKHWPHWEEVYLNAQKESPLSYKAFAQAVAAGDVSREAFVQALAASQMTRVEFEHYLPEYQRYLALCAHYADIGMVSTGVDQIWHAHMLITDRYQDVCEQILGQFLHHLPCSLYPVYGVDPRARSSSCVSNCLPSTCKGNGGGGGCKSSGVQRDEEPEAIGQSIRRAVANFIEAYTEAFSAAPDPAIWDQLV